MSDTTLSIIIPVKNEAETLPLTLVAIDNQLDALGIPAEVIVVSSGSTDNTAEIVKKMSIAMRNLKLVVNEEDQGVGASLKQGMLLSRGQFRLAINSKNLIPIDQFKNLLPHLESGAGIVVGCRTRQAQEGENYLSKTLSAYKELPGTLANFALKSMVFKELKDPTSTFVAFRSEVAEKIFNLTKYHRLKNLIEPLYIAKKSGFSIKESDVITNSALVV